LQEYGQKGKDYSPPIESGTRKKGYGERDWLVLAYFWSYSGYHFLYLDEIDDDDFETVCAHSHKITELALCIYNLNKTMIETLIWEWGTSQRATGKT
jgi:hypothetical protein